MSQLKNLQMMVHKTFLNLKKIKIKKLRNQEKPLPNKLEKTHLSSLEQILLFISQT